MALQIGDLIPEVLGKDQDDNLLTASQFKGKKLVLYFYPKDNTPGCTTQACNLRDNYDLLLKQGYAVVGVSADSAASHQKFIAKHNLPFPLIADTEKQLSEQFGTWGEKKMYGRTYMGMTRTTFVIDEKGIIEEIIRGKQVKTKEHSSQIIKDL